MVSYELKTIICQPQIVGGFFNPELYTLAAGKHQKPEKVK